MQFHSSYSQNSEKSATTAPPVARFSPQVNSHQFMLGKLYVKSFIKFCSIVFDLYLPQIFCHTHTDIQTYSHFLEIVKSCSGHPKTSNSIKNRKSNIFTKPMLSSTCIKESKNVFR